MSSAVAEPFIRVSGLSKAYRKGDQEHLAIVDATFEVAAGELVSLVGPSGCGKTTLLKILAGLQDYDSGNLQIGSATHPFDPSRDIGMVFQQALLLKWRRVLQNVLLPAEILGLPVRESRERARDLLTMVGLAGCEDKYPYELSGGMQQRLAIVRALCNDPKLLLMDEPFGALDAQLKLVIEDELMKLWHEAHPTILYVTHDLTEAITMADRVVVFSARPAQILAIEEIDIPRPRDLNATRFLPYFRDVHERLWALLKSNLSDQGRH
jgi:NitT/TauT family transport system ATP-binding protein